MKHYSFFIKLAMAVPVFCLVCLLSTAAADVLTIPGVGNNPQATRNQVDSPSRGLTMDEVRAQFGDPKEIKSPIGDPPITRWVYDNFTVHFEYNYVIHSVIHTK